MRAGVIHVAIASVAAEAPPNARESDIFEIYERQKFGLRLRCGEGYDRGVLIR
jgi:hypothetical protein